MVEVLEAPVVTTDVEPDDALEELLSPSTRNETWSRYGPLLLVTFGIGFSAWMLHAELRVLPYANDSSGHTAMARFAAQRISSGHNPFDAWYPYFGLGAPQFTQYQTLSHILTGFLSLIFGSWVFRGTNYFLLCTFPISVYAGARLLGLNRWEAGTAALFSPMLCNSTDFGVEWSSFVWAGYGMWTMLWGVWLLPIALGLSWRAIAHSERVALAAFVVGLTCAVHFMTGYLVLMAFAVFALTRVRGFILRLGRSALLGIGGIGIFAFVFVPMFTGLRYVNVDALGVAPQFRNSYGAKQVLLSLAHGALFDAGRLPVVTILVAIGTIVCVQRARRVEVARIPLGLMILSLLLYSGRTVVGPIIDYLPGGIDLMLHRYIMGVHIAGLLLAGIGAVWLFRFVVDGAKYIGLRHRRVGTVVLASALAVAALYPALADRAHTAHLDGVNISRQIAADKIDMPAVTSLINVAKQRGGGRIYSGASTGWGSADRVNLIPLYLLPLQQDADSIGYYFLSNSLSANVEPYFKDSDAIAYDLFNVRYVLVPTKQHLSMNAATLIAQRGRFSLYEVATSGYLQLVDTTKAIKADRGTMADVMAPYVNSRLVAEYRHPFVSFDGSATPAPTIDASAPYAGPPGTVKPTTVDLGDARFAGTVDATRSSWVMLKESYSPQWTATVDGLSVKPQMLAPSFVGVPVPAGTHSVVFAYKARSFYPALFTVGALVLLSLAIGPWGWRRYRRRRTAE